MYIGNDLRSGRAEVFHYTSTSGGETAVTTASDGRSIRYDVGYCNVYLNGVRLHDSDYAATTGTSITNLAALSQNDVLIVEAPSTFSTTNTVPASGGIFTGPLTIDGGINQKAAAQDLSGTYANERMYINDLYSLKGDVNITGHLALGSISSGDIVISDDGNNREISGTGTLETGGILQERNTLLTGMTGELGSTVTGSPNLNLTTGTLGSGVTGGAGLDDVVTNHFIPFLNAYQDTTGADTTKNYTVNNNCTYLWLMNIFRVDGTYQYFESFHVAVNGSGVVTISNVAPSGDTGIGIFTTGTNIVTIEVNHASYRGNGMVWKIKDDN